MRLIENKSDAAEKPADAGAGLFERPRFHARGGMPLDWRGLLTFRNAVILLGLATLLIFLGSAVSARMAFVFAALLALGALGLHEMASRRRWEAELVAQLHRMGGDHDRLVREVARNRNELAALRKSLADAGTAVRSQSRGAQDTVENRMVRAIAQELSRLGGADAPQDEAPLFDFSPFQGERPLTEAEKNDIGSILTDEQVRTLVKLAVDQDRIDLFVQPIVNLPQRKLRFVETFSRIRIDTDVYLPAERYIEAAMRQDLVPVIDNLLLLRSLQVVRDTAQGEANRAFFCNITSLTLNDPKFMGDLVEFIAQNRELAPRLVFELGQRDLATMSPDVLPVLAGLGQLGCRFSMDQVRSLSFDFAHLEARFIRFVKVDAALIMDEMRQLGGMDRLKRLKGEMDRQGIDLIAEKVETERQLIELLDLDIDYGQGYLFGRPLLHGQEA